MTFSPFRTSKSLLSFFFVAIIAIPFAAGGTLMAFLAVRIVTSAIEMRSWPTVPAILQSVQLKTHSSSKNVIAAYTYAIDGKKFDGSRVSLYNSDSIGSFQKNTYAELEGYRSRNEPYPAHVDPKDPSSSILIPVIRWEMLAFYSVFIIVFGGVGWGLLASCVFAVKRYRAEEKLAALYPNDPWRQRLEWSTPQIKSSESSLAIGLVVVAILWNACSFPIAVLALPDKLKAGEYAALLLLVFPLIGVGIFYWAIISVARASRFGKTYFELDTYPAHQGSQLRGRIFAPSALGEASEVALTLRCIKHHRTAGNRTRTQMPDNVLWTKETSTPVMKGQSASGDIILKVEFELPEDLPDSSNEKYDWLTWELSAKTALTGVDFEAEFELPVFKGI